MKNLKIKIIAILLLLTTIGTSIFAQSNSRFGIKGGVNVSNFYTKEVDSKNTIVGANVGLFLKLALNDNLSIQPELLYSMKGAELTYSGFVTGTSKFALDYIELPVMLVVNIIPNFNIQGGVYVASLARAKATNVSNIGVFDFEKTLSKGDFEKTDYGLAVGAGFDFNKVNLTLRYEYGMKNVGKARTFGTTTYTFPNANNSSLQLSLGISL